MYTIIQKDKITYLEESENNFFSNLSLIISKKNHKALDIEELLKITNNEIHDLNYFQRFLTKKNPFNILILLKINELVVSIFGV